MGYIKIVMLRHVVPVLDYNMGFGTVNYSKKIISIYIKSIL